MFITRTITKKILENIVHETFSLFGNLSCSSLLDSLKFLGFYYATNAGISINIEDLKTPEVKKDFVKIAQEEISYVSDQWQQGFVSDTERFQTIIDSWNIATESLKNRIIDYYENFDPANNLYIMAFSGARGNMSQVRQLVGMRGLMSDQEGKIIDLPIQANFREGLSSIDYIISSYGARKGIVDTALKTADSGYLTRRLIYVAQDLVIREINCKTERGLIVLLNKKTNIKNLIGRVLIFSKRENFPSLFTYPKTSQNQQINENKFLKKQKNLLKNEEIFLTEKKLYELKKLAPLTLNIRSSLTCNSTGSICQNCYGWDLAHNKIISLGEAVGIIAAQSIGEPGTQLTMRTFHTGGIFTSENLKQVLAPFSGKIFIPESLKTISYRTNHGIVVSKLQQEATIILTNWKGIKENIFLEIGSFLYLTSSGFIKKNQLLSEYSTQSIVPGTRKLKPIYTQVAGEIKFENLSVFKFMRDQQQDNRTIKVTKEDGIVWLASGKIFPIPKEFEYHFPKQLSKKKAFAKLKVITPFAGVIEKKENKLSIFKEIINNEERRQEKIDFNFSRLKRMFSNCTVTFSLIVKNYQYIDKYTVLGFFNIFPNYEEKIYLTRRKESAYITTLFIISESDIWKIHSDQVNNFSFSETSKTLVRAGDKFAINSLFSKSGFFLKKDGFKLIFQNATPIFLSLGTIINYNKGDFVFDKQFFATLVNYTQQTEDIVQGLPKIEELIEARKPKIKAYLCNRPGVLLNSSFIISDTRMENKIIKCKGEISSSLKKLGVKKEKLILQILHSLFLKDDFFLFDNKIVKVTPIPTLFQPIKKKKRRKKDYNLYYSFKNEIGEKFLLNNKPSHSKWICLNSKRKRRNESEAKIDYNIYKYKNEKKILWKSLNPEIRFQNKNKNLLNYFAVKTIKDQFLFVECINPVEKYMLSLSAKVLFNPGNFIDIGEPITEGIIDIHELLSILVSYHHTLDGTFIGTLRSLNKFQLLLVNSIQSIYQSQGVNISSKHIEIIVRQMTSKGVIKESGDTPLLPGEFFRLSYLMEIYKALKDTQKRKKFRTPIYEPFLLSTTNSSLNKEGFLSSAGFQETKRILTKASLEGISDWLRGLKECVIIGRIIPAGSAFLNYKNYLDEIYLFKD